MLGIVHVCVDQPIRYDTVHRLHCDDDMGRVFDQFAHHSLRHIYTVVRTYAALVARQRIPPLREVFRRRRYYLARLRQPKTSLPPLSRLPNGFTVRQLGKTGVSLLDNFCTQAEAQYVIGLAKNRLVRSCVTTSQGPALSETRTSETANIFDNALQDPVVLSLLYRAAILLGVPVDFAEPVSITRYSNGQQFESHVDAQAGFNGDRNYSLLIYLNDLEDGQGGETVFENLNFVVRPKCGRAVVWINKNPDERIREETRHSARPVKGAEKWVLLVLFRRYRMLRLRTAYEQREAQERFGEPLRHGESLPDGISFNDYFAPVTKVNDSLGN